MALHLRRYHARPTLEFVLIGMNSDHQSRRHCSPPLHQKGLLGQIILRSRTNVAVYLYQQP